MIYEARIRPAGSGMFDATDVRAVPDSEGATIRDYVRALRDLGYRVRYDDRPRGRTYWPRGVNADAAVYLTRRGPDDDGWRDVLVWRDDR